MTARARASAPRLPRAQPLSLLDPPPVVEPTPVPPAWAVEAAAAPPTVRVQVRDFEALRELVWHRDGQRFVCRDRQDPRDGGAHIYHAYELADVGSFGVVVEGLTPAALRPYGRIDTRRPPRAFDPIAEYSAGVDWRIAQQRIALELIRELCPETIRLPDGGPGHAVFDGPGCVTMLSRPEPRFMAFMAARRPT